jgi:hypothetical protein
MPSIINVRIIIAIAKRNFHKFNYLQNGRFVLHFFFLFFIFYLNIYITNVCPRALDSSRGLRYIYYYITPDRHIVIFSLILQSSRQIYRNTHNKLIKQRKMIAMTKLKKTLRFPNVLLNILKYHSIVFEF